MRREGREGAVGGGVGEVREGKSHDFGFAVEEAGEGR